MHAPSLTEIVVHGPASAGEEALAVWPCNGCPSSSAAAPDPRRAAPVIRLVRPQPLLWSNFR
jgi:hypothetical protein